MRCYPLLFACLCAFHSAQAAESPVTVEDLRCEYAVNPLGVDTARPRFSWVLRSALRGQMQSACQVLVAAGKARLDADTGDKWDSGKVRSAQSAGVAYEGSDLASGETCWWKVRVWDKDGKVSAWSAPATFEMGLLKEGDWEGRWIGMHASPAMGFTAGRFGRALHLDGRRQTIRIPHYAKLKPANAITISAWIKPVRVGKAGDRGGGWEEIYRKEDGNARHLLATGYGDGIRGLWVGLGINGRYVEKGANADVSVMTDGNWHLATVTYDSSDIRIYFDGAEIGDFAHPGTLDKGGTASAYIGSLNSAGEFFKGGIDDVRVYDRALSAAEIKALVSGRQGGDIRGPVGWWKLDDDLANSAEGSGGEAVDRDALSRLTGRSPVLRKEFTLEKKIKRARAYISGLGWYELLVNGKKVGDHVLDPATTDYNKRTLYVTYDVTDRLREGPNAVGVMLGNGWYSEPGRLKYGDSPRLLMQMNVEFADGTVTSVKTDRTWRVAGGPITRNDLYGGETYDARLEKPGWAAPAYDDANWDHAVIKEGPRGRLDSQLMPAIKVNKTIEPVRLTNPKPGVYVYDMGQLFGGWVRLRVKGPRGARVAIKYSARVFEDSGLVDKRRHRRGGETDRYILKGDPKGEVYEPRFTYHPVRYVQVEGYPGTPRAEDLEGRVVHSAVDMSGDFHCSNPLLNRIHKNVVWTLTNGLFGIPLDCLHREHWAWTDPATVAGTLYPRKHMPLFWTKWLDDISDAQHESGAVPDVAPSYPGDRSDPAWGGNYPLLVWYLHQYYGDERVLQEHYAGMKRWIDYLTSIAEDHIVTRGHYGDHMLPGESPGKEEFISSETPRPLVWTGYYYRGALIVSRAAGLLGKADDARRYSRLAEKIKQAFNAKWLNKPAKQYATGSQTANLFPLALGIVPEANEHAVVANVVRDIMEKRDGHLHTGNTGTTCMIDTLADHGQGDVLYQVTTTPTYPGWGYMVEQGATTIWEAWGLGGGAESMIMWATIDEFFYNDLAGIKGPDYYGPPYMTPGFRRIRIEPHLLGDLKHASASIKTVRGMVSSGWKRTDDSVALDVSVPVNSEAKVSVPKAGLQSVTVEEGGEVIWRNGSYVGGVAGITGGSEKAECVVFDVGSGSYSFTLIGARNLPKGIQ